MEDEIYHPEHQNFTVDVKMGIDEHSRKILHSWMPSANGKVMMVIRSLSTMEVHCYGRIEHRTLFSRVPFWGSLIVIGPSMLIWHRCSPRIVLITAMISYAVVTFATPFLAVHLGPIAVFTARVFMGFGEGFVIPSFNALISNWFPVDERSTVLAVYTTGNQFAGAVGNPVAAALCASSFGWPSVFYTI
ncbi:hypothetical protein OSTOST_09494, partial [Ostertagia ostertagi]